jgi:hypothetical protein
MKKTHPVVILSTEKSTIFFHAGGDLCLNLTGERIRTEFTSPQHLYILSNEETIKDGDYYKYPNKGVIWRRKGQVLNPKAQKIIATTDKSLTTDGFSTQDKPNTYIQVPLPSIPESFIKAYIRDYNLGKPITEVALEYEGHISSGYDSPGMYYTLKTRPDGSVIIHQSRMYSTQEMKDIVYKALTSGGPSPFNVPWEHEDALKWIEENL